LVGLELLLLGERAKRLGLGGDLEDGLVVGVAG
jgi:hypothetical protein